MGGKSLLKILLALTPTILSCNNIQRVPISLEDRTIGGQLVIFNQYEESPPLVSDSPESFNIWYRPKDNKSYVAFLKDSQGNIISSNVVTCGRAYDYITFIIENNGKFTSGEEVRLTICEDDESRNVVEEIITKVGENYFE